MVYNNYTSYIGLNSQHTYGCTAIFHCTNTTLCGGEGFSAANAMARFNQLYSSGFCGNCGSITYEDGISITVNFCQPPCKEYVNGEFIKDVG